MAGQLCISLFIYLGALPLEIALNPMPASFVLFFQKVLSRTSPKGLVSVSHGLYLGQII